MHRRDFMRTALVSGAAGSMAKLVYGLNGQPQSMWSPNSSPKIDYIRKEIPAFEMPPYRGERYEDLVPDTYDIAERAGLAINDLTRQNQPDLDDEIYWMASYYRNPPVLLHDAYDCETQAYWQESLPLMRIISGSDLNEQHDRIWTETLLKSIGPDGLHYTAAQGRPWIRLGIGGWMPYTLLPNGEMAKSGEAPFSQITSPLWSGRLIGVMTLHYLRDKNPMLKQTIERMIDKWSELAIDRGDYCYYPNVLWIPNSKPGPNVPMPIGTLGGENGHRLIQGMIQYYRVSGYEPARILAKRLSNYVRYHAVFFDSRGRFIDGDPKILTGHFESHSAGLLSLLDNALAVGDREMAEFVRSGYEWARTNSYGCALTGFFPESVPPNEEAIQKATNSPFRVCESCDIAEMVALAVKLTEAGVGDYWDDVDRWVRNQFGVAQLTETDWIYRVAETLPPTPVAYNESADQVAARTLGAFSAYTLGNDYGINFGAYGTPGAYETGTAGCCTGNGTRAMYYTWQRMLNYHDGQLRIHLLLNRASAWADVHGYIPYEGRVDVKIKKPCQSVLLRIPEWIESPSGQVVCTVNNTRQQFKWEGRYVKVGPAKPGDTVTVTFPISERTERNVRMGGVDYTLVIKGNTVVSVDPPGKFYPLYERKQYRASQVSWRKVKRFIPEEEIHW